MTFERETLSGAHAEKSFRLSDYRKLIKQLGDKEKYPWIRSIEKKPNQWSPDKVVLEIEHDGHVSPMELNYVERHDILGGDRIQVTVPLITKEGSNVVLRGLDNHFTDWWHKFIQERAILEVRKWSYLGEQSITIRLQGEILAGKKRGFKEVTDDTVRVMRGLRTIDGAVRTQANKLFNG